MSRYATIFQSLQARNEGAFIPFVLLGDPTPEHSLAIIDTLVAAGADALELGIPFSDPVADGPVIQAAAVRALTAGVTPDTCFAMLQKIRNKHPSLAIGLLVYANLVVHRGIDTFYANAETAEVDSVLIADVPHIEAAPFAQAAAHHNAAHVMIAAPNASSASIATIARLGGGYTYVLGRSGVTGNETAMQTPAQSLITKLRSAGTPPPIIGFGISTPEHVRAALASGAMGVISGSAIVSLIAQHLDDPEKLNHALTDFVRDMKAACQLSSKGTSFGA